MDAATVWKIVGAITAIIVFCVIVRYALLFSGGA